MLFSIIIVLFIPIFHFLYSFSLFEGLKVKVRQELSGWSEVELSDGNVGWMPSEQLEVI